jgi:hypothetical protein
MNDKIKENRLFANCKEEIGQKFFGEKNSRFKHSDFVSLSEEIFEETKVSIGLSTLKRIWADDYSGVPNISTLDALAKYIGHENWNLYRRSYNTEKSTVKFLKPFNKPTRKIHPAYYIAIFLSVFSVLLAIFINQFGKSNYQNIPFYYHLDKKDAMPVTAAFHYNLRGINLKKTQIMPLGQGAIIDVNANDTVLTYIIQWPGVFHPKLLIDGKVVKELKMEIKTNGWKAAVVQIQDNRHFIEYLNDSDIYSDGMLALTSEKLSNKGYSKGDFTTLYYSNHSDRPKIKGDAFLFETRIMNTRLDENNYSGLVRLLLTFGDSEENCIHIPVTILNEPPKSGIRIFDKVFEEKNNILSFLHIEPSKWNTIKIISAQKKVRIFINEKEVFSSEYHRAPSSFKGIEYLCNGMGKIDYVRFYDENNKLVYGDEF